MSNTISEQPQLTPKQRRSAERKRLKMASLHTRLAWWAHPDRANEGFQDSALRAEARAIEKQIARLNTLTPSTTWAEDATGLRLDRGGAFPPADENGVPLMARAIGEVSYFPRAYIVTSGHSFDTYIIAISTGTSPLLEEAGRRFRVSRREVLYMTERAQMPAERYLGSTVRVSQLHELDRRRLRKAEAEVADTLDGHEITNVL